jgi:hypothetical protein
LIPSYGIREILFLQTVEREKEWKKRKWLLKAINKVEEETKSI